jgi:hypothetical protein
MRGDPREWRRHLPLVFLKRLMLTFVLAAALAAVDIERGPVRTPTPIVMMSSGDPPRFPRARPYRAHYRR